MVSVGFYGKNSHEVTHLIFSLGAFSVYKAVHFLRLLECTLLVALDIQVHFGTTMML